MIVNENGLRYAKLIHVSVDNGKTDNSNKFYLMEEQSDGNIRCEYGRVGKPGTVIYKPSREWDKLIREKTGKKGYKDVTDLVADKVEKAEDKSNNLVDNIKERSVKELIERLMMFANKAIQQNYTVSQEAVTQKQVEEATKLVDDILGLVKVGVDHKMINNLLLELYQVIPRKMDNVKHYLIGEIKDDRSLQESLRLINNEKSSLDTMAGQVELLNKQKELTKQSSTANPDDVVNNTTILDQMGISMEEETDPKTIELIKGFLEQHANKLHKIYKVVNFKTQAAFDKQLEESDNKKIRTYWHGSRNQNWFNIIQTGLMIRPSGAGYNGSMWDANGGIYFAREADKSMGYTDGGRWVRGNSQNFSYLALFDVHLGKQLHFYEHCAEARMLSYDYLQKKGGYDSTHAHKGKSLYRDEYIIYKKEQCTIKYLVELKNI